MDDLVKEKGVLWHKLDAAAVRVCKCQRNMSCVAPRGYAHMQIALMRAQGSKNKTSATKNAKKNRYQFGG
ncbi:hypothetical protein TcasGA2_TC032484 [Tribolium castaneum]|uniref:Uncharacterized protein n=1 Tax=Tribolium castaneum TaxID=7070 RepID=A0A139WL19_TRICA|nr:hypothetical protein TcasGA2_TC032484 [Tribolium castaneum]